jgi:hypothetical protein
MFICFFATITYNNPILKVEWIGAIVLLIHSVELVSGQICQRRICKFVQPMESNGPAPLTNKKKYCIVHADNIAKLSDVRIYRKKYKNTYFLNRGGASEKFTNLPHLY